MFKGCGSDALQNQSLKAEASINRIEAVTLELRAFFTFPLYFNYFMGCQLRRRDKDANQDICRGVL